MKKHMLATVSVLVMVALLGVACAESAAETEEESVEATLRAFYVAYNNEDYERCLCYCTTDEASIITSNIELRTKRETYGCAKIHEVTDIAVAGSVATANVTISWDEDDTTDTLLHQFEKLKGNWKLVL